MPGIAALLPLIALGTGPVAAVPPPPEQVGANCEAPTYASDMRVCADPELRRLDARMRETLAGVDPASVVAPGAWVEAQEVWFRRRSLCAFAERHADCLQSAYLERIAVLEALRRVAVRPARQGTEVTCPGAPWGSTSARVRSPESGALAVEDDAARVLAAATPAPQNDGWQPFAWFEIDGSVIRLERFDGLAIVCTLSVSR